MLNSPEVQRHTAFASSDRVAIPPTAIDQLRKCLATRAPGRIGKEKIRPAVRSICQQARLTSAMPEALLVSLKELCHTLPEYEQMETSVERSAFLETVVSVAIEEFYRG